MLKKSGADAAQSDFFKARLDEIIDGRHALVRLAEIVDWEGLHADLSPHYSENIGRPAGSIRLMCGLLFLKEYSGLSDEEVCQAWSENPYFQSFCGETFFQHGLPVEAPSLSIFRKRIGENGMARLLQETIRMGLAVGVVKKQDIQRVSVDTTVQEKAVRYPTDTHLCDKARLELVKLAQENGIPIRQSYARTAKKIQWNARKSLAQGKHKQARKSIKSLKNFLGRVMRDVERGLENHPQSPDLKQIFKEPLAKAQKIFAQTLHPKTSNKLYSWHAPEVECIAKGKANKRYEFGCKLSLAVTNKSNFIVGAQALHGNPHDSKTLTAAIDQIQQLTGVKPQEAQVDLGYRGHGIKDESLRIIHPKLRQSITAAVRKRRKRRAAIEPIIGHCKNDRKTGSRNWLKGILGDKINAVALAIGFNIRKILKWIFCALLLHLFSQKFYHLQRA